MHLKAGGLYMLLRQIEYLHAVVECGSFHLAAQQCHVSQSAISQQIKKLEDELGVTLLDRHNRSFTLTAAGEHFYHKSLIIYGDIKQMIRETKRIADDDQAVLKLGYYKGYHGNELSEAVALFSEKYPTVEIQITAGSHDELYKGMENGTIDLALNDQRRAFSDAYHNVILCESQMYVEISSRNPLSKLSHLEISDLKNTPCILVINPAGQAEEQHYYEEIFGMQGEFLFADTIQDARLKIITGQGYMPVDVIKKKKEPDMTICQIPLYRNDHMIKKNYCAFWKRDNSGYYIEEFAQFLKSVFS